MFSTVKRCIHTKFGWIWSSELSASNKFSFKSVENWNFAGPQKASKRASHRYREKIINFIQSCLHNTNFTHFDKTYKNFCSGADRLIFYSLIHSILTKTRLLSIFFKKNDVKKILKGVLFHSLYCKFFLDIQKNFSFHESIFWGLIIRLCQEKIISMNKQKVLQKRD